MVVSSTSNELSQEQIENGKKECSDLVKNVWEDIAKNFDINIESKSFHGAVGEQGLKLFSASGVGKCDSGCVVNHTISQGTLVMECGVCHHSFPRIPLPVPALNGYKTLM